MKQNESILYAAGIIPVTWLALLATPVMSGGLPNLVQKLPNVMSNPFHIQVNEYIIRAVLLFVAAYVMSINEFVGGIMSFSVTGWKRKNTSK